MLDSVIRELIWGAVWLIVAAFGLGILTAIIGVWVWLA